MMDHKTVRGVYVLIHDASDPTPEEWQRYLNDVQKDVDEGRSFRVLVYTAGGSPNALQRGRLTTLTEGRGVVTAVISKLKRVRLVVKALSFFHPTIVSARTLADAADHLGLSTDDERAIMRYVRAVWRW